MNTLTIIVVLIVLFYVAEGTMSYKAMFRKRLLEHTARIVECTAYPPKRHSFSDRIDFTMIRMESILAGMFWPVYWPALFLYEYHEARHEALRADIDRTALILWEQQNGKRS